MSVIYQIFNSSDYLGNIPDSTTSIFRTFQIDGVPNAKEFSLKLTASSGTVVVKIFGDLTYNDLLGGFKSGAELWKVFGTVTKQEIYFNNVLYESKTISPGVSTETFFNAETSKLTAEKLYSGNDIFIGAKSTKYGDYVNGFAGNDIFYGNGLATIGYGSDDVFIGGDGIDLAVLSGKKSYYNIGTTFFPNPDDFAAKSLVGYSISRGSFGSSNYDSLMVSGVERLKFSDVSVALDLDGNAGITLKVLGAVFGKASVANKDYVGIGLDLLDKGMSYDALVGLALSAAQLTTNDQIVTTLWTNVVGKAPSEADKAQFIKMLIDGMAPAALAHMAADTSFNTTNINLVGLAQTGVEFTSAT